MTTLYTNGCSWTAGNGISEDPLYYGDDPKRFTWPRWLAEELGIPNVINDSLGGGSNQRIKRMTVDFVQSLSDAECKDTLIVLGFTTVERNEIYISEHGVGDWYRFNAAQKFSDYNYPELSTEKKKAVDKLLQSYVAEAYDNAAALEMFYHDVYLLKNLMENRGIRYVFFCALPLLSWLPDNRAKEFSDMLQSRIDSDRILRQPMAHFLADNKYRMTSCIHPFIDGQIAWAKNLAMIIKEKNL